MSTTAPAEQTADSAVELQIGGMTCASCAMRIEKKLNKLDGVAATVNYATEKAKVTIPAGYDPALLIAEVENDQAAPDQTELSEVRWFTREETLAMLEGTHPGGLATPPRMAIAHTLIRAWAEQRI